eukprot:TRINITY_DN1814_c0_g3_i1.p1 TRINITY_DN1814_c0_g3~~TRINITY_DN1814_c0_g3_i1.p1  ORF type:complete len:550 (-),score=132.90 TRINITY_DN1814_c0_g3_i1:526-2175(-)
MPEKFQLPERFIRVWNVRDGDQRGWSGDGHCKTKFARIFRSGANVKGNLTATAAAANMEAQGASELPERSPVSILTNAFAKLCRRQIAFDIRTTPENSGELRFAVPITAPATLITVTNIPHTDKSLRQLKLLRHCAASAILNHSAACQLLRLEQSEALWPCPECVRVQLSQCDAAPAPALDPSTQAAEPAAALRLQRAPPAPQPAPKQKVQKTRPPKQMSTTATVATSAPSAAAASGSAEFEWHSLKLSPEGERLRRKEISTISRFANQIFGGVDCIVTGSLASGLAQNNSDVDMFMELGRGDEPVPFLRRLFGKLNRVQAKIQPRFAARVPVLRAVMPSGVVFDISCSVSDAIVKCTFMDILRKACPAFECLCHLLKHLAFTHSINDASMASFSSYSLYWMTIVVLQTHGMLPRLDFLADMRTQFLEQMRDGAMNARAGCDLFVQRLKELMILPQQCTDAVAPEILLQWACDVLAPKLMTAKIQPAHGALAPRSAEDNLLHVVIVQDAFEPSFNCTQSVSKKSALVFVEVLAACGVKLRKGVPLGAVF